MALADQTDYDHRWPINPRSGRLDLWTSDTGIDGEHPVDLEDLDLDRAARFPARRTWRSSTSTTPAA